MPSTTNAFWQMVWEQGSCVIVALTRPSMQPNHLIFFSLDFNLRILVENGITMCHHYWPVEGSARFQDFEVR